MSSLVQKIVRQAHETFCSSVNPSTMATNIAKLGALVSSARASDVNLDPELVREQPKNSVKRRTVTYESVAGHDEYSIGIFVLGSDARLQLHDHPYMHGVLKVLHGRVRMDRYSHLPENEVVGSNSSGEPLRYHVMKKPSMELGAEDDAVYITPTHNFHEIRPLDGPAAFLDVLGPPYLTGKRNCHYYKEAAGASNSVIIVEVHHPDDIEHDSAEYLGPPIEVPKL